MSNLTFDFFMKGKERKGKSWIGENAFLLKTYPPP